MEPVKEIARDILFEISTMVGMRGVGYGYTVYGAFEDYTLRYHAGFVDMGGFQEDVWVRKGSKKLCKVHSEQSALSGEWGTPAQNEGKELWVYAVDKSLTDLQKVLTALGNHKVKTISGLKAFFRKWKRT